MDIETQPNPTSTVPDRPATRRRIIAFLVDATILAVVGGVLSAMFWDPLTRLGHNGYFLGLALAILYFAVVPAIGNSGQTLGHRLLNLRIASNGDATLTRDVLFKRAAVLSLGEVMITYPGPGILGVVLRTAGGVIVVLQLFFLVTQRNNGRLLHDLLANTRVVRCDATELPAAAPLDMRHRRMAAALAVVALGSCVALGALNLQGRTLLGDALMREMERDHDVQILGWNMNTTVFKTFRGESTTTRRFTVSVSSPTTVSERKMKIIAQTAMRIKSEAKEADSVVVAVVKRGPTLGIFNWTSGKLRGHSPKEWDTLADDAL